ncbi:MAG TPA: hypothetical protein VGL99_18440 [Chloroflexota bacterium]
MREPWPDAPDLVEVGADLVPIGCQPPTGDHTRIEIPADLASVKRTPEVAQAWQHHVRSAFQQAFAAGFVAVGFSRADPHRPRFLLHRRA